MTKEENRRTRLLQERAAALAQPLAEVLTAGGVDLVVMSVAGGRRYAVEARYVRQAVRVEDVARLPVSGSALIGLTTVRGEVVPLADLAALLDLAAADLARPLAVVLEGGPSPVGLLVDGVLSAEERGAHDVHSRHTDSDERRLEVGVTTEGIVVLDGSALLEDERLTIETMSVRSAPDRAGRPTEQGEP
jgi:purine-binding chemotaxis protein CheW